MSQPLHSLLPNARPCVVRTRHALGQDMPR